MAASALTPTTVTRAGVAMPSTSANADGNYFTNTGAEVLVVANAGSSITVTVVTQSTVDSLAVGDLAVTVAGATTKVIGPFPRYVYNDASSRVQITYSAVTSVTVGVLSVTPAGA